MILDLKYRYKHQPMIEMKLIISLISIFCIFFIPFNAESQSVITGTVYDFEKNEPLIGYWVVRTDSLMTDSIVPKNLYGVSSEYLVIGRELNGNFTISNPTKKNIDILINFIGYRNTIIKDIPYKNDTIYISYIPLFGEGDIMVETRLKKSINYKGIKRNKGDTIVHIIPGNVGPFSNKDEITIYCPENSKKIIQCKRERNGIEIDFSEIKTCGNK